MVIVARIGPDTVLPARRTALSLVAADGVRLEAELSLPVDREPVASVVLLHPNPLGGGSMDSHLIRKAAARLPALAGVATLRFNTRGTGASGGVHDHGGAERLDVEAAVGAVEGPVWLAGWSFGTDLALMHGLRAEVLGAVLFAPPLRRTPEERLTAWGASGKRLRVVVPALDDYLRPAEARRRFAVAPQAEVVELPGCRHLFLGHAEAALDALVEVVAPEVALPLPGEWPVVNVPPASG
ncbi:alpha/beta hydrolase [Actinokineospora sp. G85]|uniref:alpha/beta hydrolase n=1 Tax=Actinokineospora sp. G85 TaxID=3406626 RepID=UPI003C73D733